MHTNRLLYSIAWLIVPHFFRNARKKQSNSNISAHAEKYENQALSERLTANKPERKPIKGHTGDTLCAVRQENPAAQVYFIFAGDCLPAGII
ncbi:MAG: hypothetical protein IJQ62_11205 [Clostridia bacterium]|nr:hypothetical protein [Clostridia bacterium]MBR0228904.1 hypothetical protein [Clostridia bacterium]